MDIQSLDRSLQELSPFEKKLQAWYLQHGTLMSPEHFFSQREQLQQADESVACSFSPLDPSFLDFSPSRHLPGQRIALSQQEGEGAQFFLQKHPCFFPEMKLQRSCVSLIYVMYGQADFTLCSNETPVPAVLATGDLLLGAPDRAAILRVDRADTVVISGYITENALYRLLLAGCSTGLVAEYLSGILSRRSRTDYFVFHTREDPWTRQLFQHALLEFSQGGAESYHVVALTMQLIFAHVQKNFGGQSTLSIQGSVSRSRLPAFLDYLQKHYRDFSLDAMAEYFHLSPSHLSRSFHSGTGKTLRDAVRQIRLSTAEILLQSSALSIAEIAEATGYEDVSYFIEVFRKKHGMTPLQYRTAP